MPAYIAVLNLLGMISMVTTPREPSSLSADQPLPQPQFTPPLTPPAMLSTVPVH
jgi:hypothetical protein